MADGAPPRMQLAGLALGVYLGQGQPQPLDGPEEMQGDSGWADTPTPVRSFSSRLQLVQGA